MTGQDGLPCEHDLAPELGHWMITHQARPVTMNEVRRKSDWRAQRSATEEWRQAAFILTKKVGIPHLERARFEATPFGPGRAQDPGNCYPTVKAMIDGVVDAGVLDDDDGEHVTAITLFPWQRAPGSSGLRLHIYEVTDV